MVKYVGGLIMESGVYLMDDDAFLNFIEAMSRYYDNDGDEDG